MEPFDGKPLYVSGKFPGQDQGEIWAILLGFGAYGVTSKSVAKAYLCADPTDPKLLATGKPLYTLADLGAPLAGYRERLEAAMALRRAELKRWTHCGHVAHLGFGPPADAALIARVEAATGPLPEEIRTLMGQFNGLSCVVATLKQGATLSLPDGAPLPYGALADSEHPLWQGQVDWMIGTIGIPTWEDIFLRPQKSRICDHTGYEPKDILKIGSLKVKAGELFPRLYGWDLYHHFGGAALYLDPADGRAKVIYTFDYWADLTSAHPIPLRAYMESLVAGLWHRASHAAQRPIRPVSRGAWPTYIRNVHGAPYVFVELK